MKKIKATGITKTELIESRNTARRRSAIVEAIAQHYTLSDELSLVNKAIEALSNGDPLPDEYNQYRSIVVNIKETTGGQNGD